MKRRDIKPVPELTPEAVNDLVTIMGAMFDILHPLQSRMEGLYRILEKYEPGSKRAKYASLFVDDAKGSVVAALGELEEAMDYLTRENDKGLRRPA